MKIRMIEWLIATALLLIAIAILRPQLLAVDLHKISLITLAGVVLYWLDVSLFPYARPDRFLAEHEDKLFSCQVIKPGSEIVFAAAMLRRAIIIGSGMIGVALGA